MLKRLYLLILILIPFLSSSQVAKKKINLAPINSIDSDDFSDLTFLDEHIENKKVVFLGESHHGIDDFHQLKFRLIKYLHQKHGFEVVAFESGVANIGYTELFKDSLTGMEMLAHSLMGFWRVPVNCELMTYSRDNKLHLSGLDPFSKSLYFTKEYYHKLDLSEEIKNRLFYADSAFSWSYSLEKSKRYSAYKKDGSLKQSADLDSISAQLRHEYSQVYNKLKAPDTYQNKILRRGILSNLQILNNSNDLKSPYYYGKNQLRDSSMARNLEYLIDSLYPNKKIIVLAHNIHIQKTTKGTTEKGKFKGTEKKQVYDSRYSIGVFLNSKIKSQSYVIGLLATNGTYTNGYNPPAKIKLKRRSLERIINGFNSKAAFTPTSKLKGINYKTLKFNVYTYTKEVENLFDAIIFVKDVKGIRIIRKSDGFKCE